MMKDVDDGLSVLSDFLGVLGGNKTYAENFSIFRIPAAAEQGCQTKNQEKRGEPPISKAHDDGYRLIS